MKPQYQHFKVCSLLLPEHRGNEIQNLRIRLHMCVQYPTCTPGWWTLLSCVHVSVCSPTIVATVIFFALTFEVLCMFLMSLSEYHCYNRIFYLEVIKTSHSQQRLRRVLGIEQEASFWHKREHLRIPDGVRHCLVRHCQHRAKGLEAVPLCTCYTFVTGHTCRPSAVLSRPFTFSRPVYFSIEV